jgi:hypothetical protein
MPNDIVRPVLEFFPRISGNTLEDAVRPQDATLGIRSGEEQLLDGEIALFVN